jgi:hypothetical protein
MIRSKFSKIGLLALLLCLAGGSAFADMTFDIQGSTTGQFYLGSTNIAMGTSLIGLSFNGSTFTDTVVPPGGTQIDLGTFNLATLLAYYDPFDFKLSVSLTAPTVGGTTFQADLSGLVSIIGGAATINFVDNGPRHFTFSNAQGSGAFDLYISDVSVGNFSSKTLVGTISNATFAANPEPAAILLSAVLLGGIAIAFRKRIRNC